MYVGCEVDERYLKKKTQLEPFHQMQCHSQETSFQFFKLTKKDRRKREREREREREKGEMWGELMSSAQDILLF